MDNPELNFRYGPEAIKPVSLECIEKASVRYQVPEALLLAILKKEGGKSGLAVKNKNGTFDLGAAQINTSWLPELAKYGITEKALKNNGCLNIYVSSWIIARHYYNSRDWTRSVIWYHTGPKATIDAIRGRGVKYANDVIKYWTQYHEVSKDFGHSPVQFYKSRGYK